MKKKVVLLITGLHFGGMERVAFIAHSLLKDEYDVKMVALYTKDADYSPDFEYIDLKCPPLQSRFGKIINTLNRIRAVRNMKAKLNPDIVMSFGTAANFANVTTKNNESVILGIRSYDWLNQYFINFRVDKWTYNKADKVVSVSRVISEEAIEKFQLTHSKTAVLYNPYDVKSINELSEEPITEINMIPEAKVLLAVGRLVDQKGFNHLIKAFSLVLKAEPDTILVIIGKGHRENDLKDLIEKFGIEKNVILLGGHRNPYKFMRRANLYVLSSLTEGFPNAMVEAMSVGLPVIAADCKSGPREILSTGKITTEAISFEKADYGFIVPKMSGSLNYDWKVIEECDYMLAEGIKKIINDSSLINIYKEKAYLRAQDFNYQKFHTKINKIFNGN